MESKEQHRIILSRKGFDSGAGGKAKDGKELKVKDSILVGEDLISFPIPEESDVRYRDLFYGDDNYEKILCDLGYVFDNAYETCHLDPDIEYRKKEKTKNWKKIFGQTGSAAGYLCKSDIKVSVGDIFLFFGRFRRAEKKNGKYNFIENESKQIIWGYLQVGKILIGDEIVKNETDYSWHPHTKERYTKAKNCKNNTLFIAKDFLELEGVEQNKYPGASVLKYSPKRVLTKKSEKTLMSVWEYKDFYDDKNIVRTKRKNAIVDQSGVQYKGQWQEIILKDDYKNEQLKWLKKVLGIDSDKC